MGTISSGVGLISGINSKDIIDQLMQIESQKKDLVQARIDSITAQKTAYTDISVQISTLKLSAQSLQKPSFFQSAVATSSNQDVLTATANNGALAGSYQFQVARTVTTQQSVTRGFTDSDTAPVGAGNLTIELGGGEVTQENTLDSLRGGDGVSRGKIRITDETGKSTILDLSDAVTLDDVVKKINTSVDINVKASVNNDRLILTDQSGGLNSDLIVQDVGDTTTAADLGIAGSNILGQINGSTLQYVGRNTKLATLNDGNGVSNKNGADFTLNFQDGTNASVDIGTASTVGEVLDAINTAGGGKVTAQTVSGGKGIRLVDNTTGGGAFSVAAVGTSTAAADLGLTAAAAGNQIDGDPIISRLGTVLLKTLNGGHGLSLGTISVQNRNGATTSIDFNGALTLQTAIDTINNSGAGVKAEVNSSGNGIQIKDTTGGTGDLQIADISGTGAAQLGIAGTFTAGTEVVKGANLQRKWVNENIQLQDYNGGKGVSDGNFKITAKDGTTATIKITSSTDQRLADVITKINDAFAGKVVASINAHGDGLQLTDTTGGTGKLIAADDNGTTAQDLGLAGESSTNTLDGSLEKTIAISSTDTLASVQTKINDLSFGINATILNDGTGDAPYRLNIASRQSGRAGRVVFDAGTTNLDARTLIQAKDAAVFVGASDGTQQPLLITSSTNTIKDAVKGVSIELHGVSSTPVTVDVTRDITNVVDEVQKFSDNFNTLVDKIADYTKFDTDTLQRGILLGDGSVTDVQTQLYAITNSVVAGAGRYRIFADIGLTVGDGGHLTFDKDKFNTAYATDPQAVEELFTLSGNSISKDTNLSLLNSGNGIATAGDGVPDFKVTLKDGSNVNVSLGTVSTLGEVVSSINSASPSKLQAEITDDGRIKLKDLTGGTGHLLVAPIGGSQALFDLGLSITDERVLQSDSLKVNDAFATSTSTLGSLNSGAGVRTAGTGIKDFQISLKDGSNIQVSLAGATTVGNVLTKINTQNAAKVIATLNDEGRIKITDLTKGSGTFNVSAINGSNAITDLGLANNGSADLSGRVLKPSDLIAAKTGGLGLIMQQHINKIIDPVSGLITQTNKELDSRTQDYQDRITQIDALLAQKRLRLEKQFANLESVLGGLQGQQQALGSLSKSSG